MMSDSFHSGLLNQEFPRMIWAKFEWRFCQIVTIDTNSKSTLNMGYSFSDRYAERATESAKERERERTPVKIE